MVRSPLLSLRTKKANKINRIKWDRGLSHIKNPKKVKIMSKDAKSDFRVGNIGL